MKGLLGISGILGIILLALGNIGSIGYGLYLWGGTGMVFALAAWTAFKVWMVVMVLGLGLFLNAMFNANKSSKVFRESTWKNLR